MEILRTPEERFVNLPAYPFAPHYVEVDGLRIHYVDEGPREADPVLMLHGEPSWSYLYRKIIPIVAAARYRVIAPDLVGFGRSDKPTRRQDYTYQRHVEWMRGLILALNLQRITLVGQDWGGFIGLRLAAEQEDRFARIVAANTALPTGDLPPGEGFLNWRRFSQETPIFRVGDMVKRLTVSEPPPEVRAAYDAPFPDERYTELVSCEQDDEGVSAIIRDRKTGQERTVRARHLVAADGNNSSVRQHLGIAVHGPGSLAHQINFLFDADLREALRGRLILVGYVNNPVVQGGVIATDVTGRRGPLSIPYHPEKGEREEDFAGERSVALIHAAVGTPDLPVKVVEMRTGEMAAFVAERFQQGRIFLAGDSAHVMPPTGGFGVNTGIQDAHNLAWKLAFVLRGLAGPSLLATYDAERRP